MRPNGLAPTPLESPAVTDDSQPAAPGSTGAPGAPDGRDTVRGVDYKGAPLDAARGPGLGCFWIQIVALGVLIVLTPLSAAWEWPVAVTIVLLAAMLVLLLLAGQTVIFLLRLVAADRRAVGRRRPLRSGSRTVGQIEDEAGGPSGDDGVRE
jgi:hypothetical protein